MAEPLFVVADGMGGARAGEVASQTAVDAFEQGLPDDGSPEQRLAVVIRARQRAHPRHGAARRPARRAWARRSPPPDRRQRGLDRARRRQPRLRVARRRAARRSRTTTRSSPSSCARGKLTEEQAAEHPQRSIITRALGPEAAVEVETRTYPLRDGDVYLLCSDGLTSMIDDATVAGRPARRADARRAPASARSRPPTTRAGATTSPSSCSASTTTGRAAPTTSRPARATPSSSPTARRRR